MLRQFRRSFRNLGPNRDAHNERIKLIATMLNAIGLASLVGGFIGPLLDLSRPFPIEITLPTIIIWLVATLAAYHVLGYTQAKD